MRIISTIDLPRTLPLTTALFPYSFFTLSERPKKNIRPYFDFYEIEPTTLCHSHDPALCQSRPTTLCHSRAPTLRHSRSRTYVIPVLRHGNLIRQGIIGSSPIMTQPPSPIMTQPSCTTMTQPSCTTMTGINLAGHKTTLQSAHRWQFPK